MRSPHEFYYRIQAPPEVRMEKCVCGEEILPFVSVLYFYKDAEQAGCSECICSNLTYSSKLKCTCAAFSAETDYIYTHYSTGECCGCSECIETRYF